MSDEKSDENKDSPSTKSSLSEREQVERTADRLRDELMLTIEELDRRRERVLDLKYQGKQLLDRNREFLLTVGGVTLGVVALGVGYSMWRAHHRREVVWSRRGKALRRAWKHPDQVASASAEKPLALELGRKLFFIFGTALATALARNAVQTLVPPTPPAAEQDKDKSKPPRLALHLAPTPAHA